MYNGRKRNVSANERGTQVFIAVVAVVLWGVMVAVALLAADLLWDWLMVVPLVAGLCMVCVTFLEDFRVQVAVAAVYCAALIFVGLSLPILGWLWMLPALLAAIVYIVWTCYIVSQTGRRKKKPIRKW